MMSGVTSVKQDASVATQPHLSLVLALPTSETSLAALQASLSYLAKEMSQLPSYEIVLVENKSGQAEGLLDIPSDPDTRIRVVACPESVEEQSRSQTLLSALSSGESDLVLILDCCRPDHPENLPSPETLASMLLAAESADLVIASRYLPGADASTVTNSQGLRRDFHNWRVSEADRLAFRIFLPRLVECTDPGSTCFLFHRAVIEKVQVPASSAGSSASPLLLEILVRGQWTQLTETPYRGSVWVDRPEPRERVITGPGQLHSLRSGRRERGPVRYRYQRLTPGPEDPEPLDDELPDASEPAGRQRRRLLWTIGLLGLVLRIILLPIGHWWDLTVDYNTFIDLARNISPYTTMQYLSHIAYASQWDYNYEYYAYPPVPLYIYYPLAHIYAWLHPGATYYIPVSGTYAMPDLSFDFFLLLKLPIWIADFLIAALLARMSGTIRGFRDYLLNPYVLLVSGAWTFDAIGVLGLVLAVYYVQKGKMVPSGLALAFGTMVKFIPAVAAPTIALYLIKKKRPVREIVLYLAAYGVGCVVLLGPFWNGLLYVINFHSNRVPGGMTWIMFWRLSTFFPPGTDLDPTSLALGAFGTPTLIIALLLAYLYAFQSSRMGLNRMILVTLLAFLIGSKLVNEQYALVIFPFAFIEARRVGGAWRWLARLLWIVPLLFAVVRVEIDRFVWLLYRSIWGAAAKAIAVTAKTGFSWQFIPWDNLNEQHLIVLVLAVGFTVLCLVAFFWPLRPSIRTCRHLQAIESVSTRYQGSSPREAEPTEESSGTPAPAIALQ
jgi:hypothetical protein